MARKKGARRRKLRWGRVILCFFASILLLLFGTMAFCLYGPNKQLRDLYVTTFLQTSAMKFMATAFLPQKTIEEILDNNKIIADQGNTDPSLIQITGKASPVPASSPTPLPAATPHPLATPGATVCPTPTPSPTPVPTPGKLFSDHPGASDITDHLPGLQLVNLSGNGYKGYMLIVTDPTRVSLAVSKSLGSYGQRMVEMAADHDALAIINGGEFDDPEGHGNGGTPAGCLVQNGQPLFLSEEGRWNIIGLNQDHVLVLGNYSFEEMQAAGIVDAVTFGYVPYLIVNGEPSKVVGNGGSGLNPRTAIGQRADGAILMLVIDGRQPSSIGATQKDVMDIMLDFGAVNAANLDGGSSSVMVIEGNVINSPCAGGGFGRYAPDGFMVSKLPEE
nr:phosphodiester glycosidase family protein [bacterium]